MGSQIDSLGLTGILLSLAVQWFINTGAMWLVINWLMEVEGGASLGKCALCTSALSLWGIIAFLPLLLIPFVYLYLICLIVWFFGAKAIVEGMFEMVSGAVTVLVLYAITLLVIGALLASIMGA